MSPFREDGPPAERPSGKSAGKVVPEEAGEGTVVCPPARVKRQRGGPGTGREIRWYHGTIRPLDGAFLFYLWREL